MTGVLGRVGGVGGALQLGADSCFSAPGAVHGPLLVPTAGAESGVKAGDGRAGEGPRGGGEGVLPASELTLG